VLVFHSRILPVFTVIGAVLSTQPASAQQSQQWFVPNQPRQAVPSRPAPAARPLPAPMVQGEQAGTEPGLVPEGTPGAEGQVQVQLPPPPEVAPLPKGPTPPAAIVGVLSLADVVRASAAFQAADKEFVGRRQKLNEDAQKEQQTLTNLNQGLANDR